MKTRLSFKLPRQIEVLSHYYSPTIASFFPFTARTFASIKPANNLFIFKGNKLTLLGKQFDSTYTFITEKNLNDKFYNEVKTVSHIPLYLHILLLNSTPLKKTAELKKLLERIEKAKLEITLTPPDAKIQLQILNKTTAFIEDLLESASIDEAETQKRVEAFFATISPEYKHNRNLGADIQLNKLHSAVQDIKQKFSVDFKDSHVVFVCPFEPRKKLIEKQYFEHLYKRLSISIENNIFYIEKIPQDLAKIDAIKEVPALLYTEAPVEVSAPSCTPPSSTSSSSILKAINSAFLQTHVEKSKEMLACIETIVIYHQANISLWKFNADLKEFECVKNQLFDSTQHFETVIDAWQKEYNINFEKTRIIIAGKANSNQDHPIKADILKFYDALGINKAENRLVYYVESTPGDGSIKTHFIDKFLTGAELNQTYGQVVNKDPSLMFSDVMGDMAEPRLEKIFSDTAIDRTFTSSTPTLKPR